MVSLARLALAVLFKAAMLGDGGSDRQLVLSEAWLPNMSHKN